MVLFGVYFFFPLLKEAYVVSCWEYLFLFFHLKEILRTCQVYCVKVITEPGGKDLSSALVMCCSDHFSFQSKINYCFIMRMFLRLHFIHRHRKTIHVARKIKDKSNKSDHLTRCVTYVTVTHPSLVSHFIDLRLAWKVFYYLFVFYQLSRPYYVKIFPLSPERNGSLARVLSHIPNCFIFFPEWQQIRCLISESAYQIKRSRGSVRLFLGNSLFLSAGNTSELLLTSLQPKPDLPVPLLNKTMYQSFFTDSETVTTTLPLAPASRRKQPAFVLAVAMWIHFSLIFCLI